MPTGRTWLLAIDTATDQAAIALFDGTRLATRSWPGGRQQTTGLLPEIESMALAMAIDLEDIGAIAVAIGPGSFTGLRVGLSVAKGMVLGAKRDVIGISTLDITAAPYAEAMRDCVAVAPAGRGRVVWATYGDVGGSKPANATFEEFLSALREKPDPFVVGELDGSQRSSLEEIGVRCTSPGLGFRQPGALAQLAWERWQAGDVDEPVALEPAYLHGRPNPR